MFPLVKGNLFSQFFENVPNIFFFLQFQAIQRSNIPAIATTNIADIAFDLVNPSAVELVLDIRREYTKKLEQVTFLC